VIAQVRGSDLSTLPPTSAETDIPVDIIQPPRDSRRIVFLLLLVKSGRKCPQLTC